MDLDVSETPAKMTTRRRTVKFDKPALARILAEHCRAQGVAISDGCALHVQGVEISNSRGDIVTLFIDGD